MLQDRWLVISVLEALYPEPFAKLVQKCTVSENGEDASICFSQVGKGKLGQAYNFYHREHCWMALPQTLQLRGVWRRPWLRKVRRRWGRRGASWRGPPSKFFLLNGIPTKLERLCAVYLCVCTKFTNIPSNVSPVKASLAVSLNAFLATCRLSDVCTLSSDHWLSV